jgi:hypothetical protein
MMRLKKERLWDLIYFHQHPEEHPDSDYCCDASEEAALTLDYAALAASHEKLVEALKGVLPYMEAAETAGLVGDEGCHWPVEVVRVSLAEAEKLTK